jgi:hypothetical protein
LTDEDFRFDLMIKCDNELERANELYVEICAIEQQLEKTLINKTHDALKAALDAKNAEFKKLVG